MILLEFEQFLKNFLEKRFSTKAYGQKLLKEAMFYSLFNRSASRFRPRLCFAVNRLLGQAEQKIFPWAGAIEMIHCASLIHDDLPAMDNAEIRRHQLSNHLKFGEDMALLAGDCLFVESFALLSSDPLFREKPEMWDLFVSKVGFQGLMGGQALDLKGIESSTETKDQIGDQTKDHTGQKKDLLSRQELLRRLKTGALIEASGLGPLLLWGKEADTKQAIQNFCHQLGIAYQIADDLRDQAEDQEKEQGEGRGENQKKEQGEEQGEEQEEEQGEDQKKEQDRQKLRQDKGPQNRGVSDTKKALSKELQERLKASSHTLSLLDESYRQNPRQLKGSDNAPLSSDQKKGLEELKTLSCSLWP